VKLLNQDRLAKPAGHASSEWTLDFRYDTEAEDEPGDRDRCEAKAQLDKWNRANDALADLGEDVRELLGPEPVVPEPRRRVTAVLCLLPPGTPYNQGTDVFSGQAVCSHDDPFVREHGRQQAVAALGKAILAGRQDPGARPTILTPRDAKTLAQTMLTTYFSRPRPRNRDLGDALGLLRRFHAAACAQEPTGIDRLLEQQTRTLLARYPAPAKNKRPEGGSGHKA